MNRRMNCSSTRAGVLPAVTCLVIVWLLTGLTRNEWIAVSVCLALATAVYLAARRQIADPHPA